MAAGMYSYLNVLKAPAGNNTPVNEDFFFAHKNHIPAAPTPVAVWCINLLIFLNEKPIAMVGPAVAVWFFFF